MSVDASSVSLRWFYPDPNVITVALGIEPDRVIRGMTRRPVWVLDSKMAPEHSIQDHIDAIFGQLCGKGVAIRDLIAEIGTRPSFYCGFHLSGGQGEQIKIDDVILNLIADIGATLDIRVYWSG